MSKKFIGKIRNNNDFPHEGIKVEIWHNKAFKRDELLARGFTDKNGKFRIQVLDEKLESNLNCKKLNLKIRFFKDEDLIFEDEKENVNVNIDEIDLGTVIINLKGNIGVEGRVIDENGHPIKGLVVTAEDIDLGKVEPGVLKLVETKMKSFIPKEEINPLNFFKNTYKMIMPLNDYLGSSITDKDGYYHIFYPPEKYEELLDGEPDIRVSVKDKLGVFELAKTEIHSNVKDQVETMDDITVNRSRIEGWFITLDDVSPSRFTKNNDFKILIDNQLVLEKVVNVIERAKSYIYLTQYEFYPDLITKFHSPLRGENKYEPANILVDNLLEAQNRGVDVKIILNENVVVPDSYDEINDYFKDSLVDVRRFSVKGPYAMHAKVLVVDGKEALIIGSPFKQSFWDTNNHMIHEPRRGSNDMGPVHDVSIYLQGGSVVYVEEFFIELWNYLSDEYFHGQDKITPQAKPLKTGRKHLQIARSITPKTIYKKGELGILEAYRRAITNAEKFIYIENQYFTNKFIIESVKNALRFNPELQLVMVINQVPDVPSYLSWQDHGLRRLGLDLESLLDHPQIGVFTLWSGGYENGKLNLRHCYVHSKIGIVDDKWATIGTANLDGSSLSCAEEFFVNLMPKDYLNMEMNALIFDIDELKTDEVKKMRESLWSEHLGMNIGKKSIPKDGWLDLWKEVAYENIKALEEEEITLYGDILPYSTKKDIKEQIRDMIEQSRRIKDRLNL